MKTLFILALGGAALSVPASADLIPFSGTGTSGVLSASSETWHFNMDGGAAFNQYLNNWGGPGVNGGEAVSGETVDVFGMQITFTGGGPIDASAIAIGNSAGCAGSTAGGTTFCTFSPTDVWAAIQTGSDSISFLAQDPSFNLLPGQDYFANIYFDGATPTGFTGEWLTTFTPTPPGGVPEPAASGLLGAGLVSLVAISRSRRHARSSGK
jgi:hypothetical protein